MQEKFSKSYGHIFVGEKDRFIVIYLDDMIVFSKTYEDHIKHLRQTFVKCKKFGLSLNPKSLIFL
jgi:hypothetical protein